MSQILTYLTKKWRTLSEKMFEVAEHGRLQPNNSLVTFPQCNTPSTMEVCVPPDLPIKAKVKIHQVSF